MDKLLPRLVLIATASISLSEPAIAEWQLASPLPSSFMTRPNGAVVLVAGMGGDNTTGGMGAGTTGGRGFGTAGGSPSWNSLQPAYYAYQCVTQLADAPSLRRPHFARVRCKPARVVPVRQGSPKVGSGSLRDCYR